MQAVIAEILEDLPDESFDISCELIRPLESQQTERAEIRVSPNKATACPLIVNVDKNAVVLNLTVGRSSPIEIPVNGQFDLQDGVATPRDELQAIVRAAVEGNVHERVWIAWGEIIQSEATIDLPENPLSVSRGGGYAPLKAEVDAIKQEIDYEPYVGPSPLCARNVAAAEERMAARKQRRVQSE